ncbi:hypothetical protein BLNAU_11620 [Blattamonas nauphoetae]|uniref:Uncharacterized protein n=1 Tax=Blattamonas nauphoetae TaxID=2049346 RepID=A0ABQ9XSG6_9EUKA|nr:hypothetical protein BLNAU_11620 [Blattamonas nauphoetae]
MAMSLNSEIEQQKFLATCDEWVGIVEKVGERAKKDFEAREWNEFQIFTNLLHRIVQEQFCPSNAEFLSFFVFARTIDSIEHELQTFRSEQMNLSHESLEPAAHLTLPRNSYYMPLPSTLHRLHNIKTQESHFKIPFVPRITTSESVFNSFRHLFIIPKKKNSDPNSVANQWSILTDPQFIPSSSQTFDAQTFEQDDETLEKSLQNCLRIVTDNPRSPQVQLSNEFVLNLLQFLSSPNDQLRALSHQITVILAKSQAFRSILLEVGPDCLRPALREGTVEQVHAYLLMCEAIITDNMPLSSDPEYHVQLSRIEFDFNDFCDVKVDSVPIFGLSLLLVGRFMMRDLCKFDYHALTARLRRFVSSRRVVERLRSYRLDSSELWMLVESFDVLTPCLEIFFLLQLPIPDSLNWAILNSRKPLVLDHIGRTLIFAKHVTAFPPNFMVDVIAERIWRDSNSLEDKTIVLLHMAKRLPPHFQMKFFKPYLCRGVEALISESPNTINNIQYQNMTLGPDIRFEIWKAVVIMSGHVDHRPLPQIIQSYPARYRVTFWMVTLKLVPDARNALMFLQHFASSINYLPPFELAHRARSIILRVASACNRHTQNLRQIRMHMDFTIRRFIEHFSPLLPHHFNPLAILTPLLQGQPPQLLLEVIPSVIQLGIMSLLTDQSPLVGGDLARFFGYPTKPSWIQSWLGSITFQVNPNHERYVNILVKDVLKCLFNENEGIGSKALLGVYDLVRRSSAEGMIRLIELGLVGCVISAVERSESLEDYEIGCWILSRVFRPHLLSIFTTRYYRPVSSW